jgi:hypothetical protein
VRLPGSGTPQSGSWRPFEAGLGVNPPGSPATYALDRSSAMKNILIAGDLEAVPDAGVKNVFRTVIRELCHLRGS